MMRISGWKHALALSLGLLAVAAGPAGAEKPAQKPFADADHVIYSPARGVIVPKAAGDVSYHGGGVIVSAKVVLIFWGPSFAAGGADNAYATALQAFRNQLGGSGAWTVVTQYSGIQYSNLGTGTADWFDTSTPPTNVTDAKVRAEVTAYLATHTFDSSAIYEVVIPKSSYSSSGTSTSCGGPSLAYCAYHGSYSGTSGTVIYSIQPYPSCSGCQVSGWSTTQDQEHLICHETRDTVTNPVNGWWNNSTGAEICSECAWSPTPFPTTPPATCEKCWSNAVHGCV